MKIFACILFLLAFANSSFSQVLESNIELIYSGIKLKIPNNHLTIGSMGGEDNFLVFKYSNEAGKKYLAFTNMTKSNFIDHKCEINVFFHDAFNNSKKSKCNQEELKLFKEIFLNDNDFGVWSGQEYFTYYTISNNESFLFIVHKSGKTIKVDTDFLDKKELKKIIDQYLD